MLFHIVPGGLIPLYSIRITASLVILQGIRQCGCIASEGEVIAGIWRQHYRTAHVEAVQVAGQTCGGHTQLMIIKIITGREADVPSVADTNVTVHIQVLGELVWISHRFLVELLY